EIRSVLAPGVQAFTPNTLRDEARVLAEIARVRRDGYATNREEEVIGVNGVAAPVTNADGAIVAALCVGYPTARATEEYEAFLRDATIGAARRLSALISSPEGAANPIGGT